MSPEKFLTLLIGILASPRRHERGLSQSTENVILLVGAVAVAAVVITVVMNYVNGALVLRPW